MTISTQLSCTAFLSTEPLYTSLKHICYILLISFISISTLNAQTYTTVQDGPWTNAATWDANGVPPIDLNNDTVNLNHEVILGSTLKLQGNSTVNVNTIFTITGNIELEFSTDILNISFGVIITNNGDIVNKHGTVNFDKL